MPRRVPAKPRRRAAKARAHGKGRTPSRRAPGFSRLRRLAWRLGALLIVVAGAYTAWLDTRVRAQFEGKRWSVPARIYARPLELFPGLRMTSREFVQALADTGYHRVARVKRPGSYARTGGIFHVATRGFHFWDKHETHRRLDLQFRSGVLTRLRAAGKDVSAVRLPPPEIGRIYPHHREDRVLVKIERVPELLVHTLIAVEDRRYFSHMGISPRAIARAAFSNLRAGATVQGGSTLTQQLAKNFFLTPERTMWRKLNEAIIALLLEARYSKQAILQAYLNEVFLGQQGGRAIHGFGLAAWFYYGRRLEELNLPETALLVALVRGPSYYNPRRHAERAHQRRGLVLDALVTQGVISRAQADAARATPLGVTQRAPGARTRYPAFIDLVRRQLRRDYGDAALRSRGLHVFTTLDPRAQRAAEDALTGMLPQLERRARISRGGLQGAVTVTGHNGDILALVGSRAPRRAEFNRALDAIRPIGSLVKPALYLTALSQPGRYTLSSVLRDVPLRLAGPRGTSWRPRNYDGRSHGRVPLHQALAQSYNLAAVHLGLDLGVENVASTLRRLGVKRPVKAYPAMLLGALELAPIEIAQMYQTLANGGVHVPLRAIRAVSDAGGELLAHYGLGMTRAVAPEPVFLVVEAMKEVMRTGTGRAAYAHLPRALNAAGKTGSTDGLRDSWFAGFGGDRLAVVWVGRDDNRPANLSGASGALRVWTQLMRTLAPRPSTSVAPPGIEWHWVSADGRVSTDPGCAGATRLPYITGSAPPYAPCGGRMSAHAAEERA